MNWVSQNNRSRRRCLGLSALVSLLIMQGCSTKPKSPATPGVTSIPGVSAVKSIGRATATATLKAPIGATRIGAVVLYDRLRTMTLGNAPLPANTTLVGGKLLAGAGGEAFEQLLDRQKLPPRSSGSVKFMVDGAAFFPTYLRAINEARSSIDAQTFIFDNDDVAVSVADALKAKSMDVPVRVYYDGNGSDRAAQKAPKHLPPGFSAPKDMQDYLTKNSNIQVRRSANPYMVADHTKLHIIDGQTAFIGGMNIGREYRYEWHDMMSRVQGPVVQPLREMYEKRWRGDAWWRKLGPRSQTVARPRPSPGEHLPQLRILRTETRGGKREVLRAVLIAIRCASQRVWLQTPYYSSDEVTAELEAAVKRGVDVRVVVPDDVDYQIMEANNSADLKKLIDVGAKVYAYPGMTHLKATVCDDWAMWGSANYDTLSLRVNVELNLATSDPRTVNTIASQVFERDFRTARRMTAAMAEAKAKSAVGPLAEFAGDQL